MERTGVASEVADAIASVALVSFQVGVPGNGTGENATNGTNVTNATNGIEQRTERAIGLFERIWPEGVPMPPNWLVRLVLALVVLIVAWYGSKLVVRLFSRRVARRFRRPSVVQTVLGSVRSAIMLVAVFVAVGVAGFLQVGDLVISATVLTGATILVLTPIIGSVVNGLLILADRPYEIGDMIEFVDSTDRNRTGRRGFVEDITLRYTKIFTLDNTFIVVPNSTMRDRDVINYSAQDPRTRLSLDVLVTYEGDLGEARDLIERAAREVDVVVTGGPDIRIGSARYPAAPTCHINEFADHGVLLTLRYWAREPYELLMVRSAVQENVWAALEDADVEMAYPHSQLVFDETSGTLPVSIADRSHRVDDGRDRPEGERRPADGGRPAGTDAGPSDERPRGRRRPPSSEEESNDR